MISLVRDYSNQVLDVEILRYLIFIISGVFMGYTLQPVPDWLNHWFNTSQLFKFTILVAVAMVALYPLDDNEVRYIFVGSFLALVIFMIFRKIDEQYKRDAKNAEESA